MSSYASQLAGRVSPAKRQPPRRGHRATAVHPARALQRQVGNRAVGGLLGHRASVRPVGTRPPSAALDLIVPDFAIRLDRSDSARIQQRINNADFAAALAACVEAAERVGAVDVSVLAGGQVNYVAGLQGGRTRARWSFRYSPPSGPWRLDLVSQEVSLGDSAMGSVSMLYSALLHEWRHVRTNDRWNGEALVAPPTGGRYELAALPTLDGPGRRAWSELDAYCWQIEHAEALGHDRSELRLIKAGLQTWVGPARSRFRNLPAALRDPAERRYQRALTKVDRLMQP